jgi:MFS family permease
VVAPHVEPTAGTVDDATLQRAKVAVSVAFIAAGLAFASWASRIPQVRDRLHLEPGQLGLLLLSLAIGSLIALPLAGLAVARFGERRTVTASSLLVAAGIAVIAVGYHVGWVPVALGLVAAGFGFGMWDVAMNVQGAYVEQLLGRSIMARLHAGFSIGTVAGSGIGAAMVAIGVGVTAHLLATMALLALVLPAAVGAFLVHAGGVAEGDGGAVDDAAVAHKSAAADGEAAAGHGSAAADGEAAVGHGSVDAARPPDREPAPRRFAAWTEPRTLVIGLFVLCMAFAEGTGNDWLAVATIDGYGTSAALGTVTFAIFLASMTAGRWFGPTLIDQHGRAPVLRAAAAVAALGLALVAFGGSLPVAMVGAAIWGLGTALGFPTGMSAAADDPAHAAARVSVVSSIGYVAFLAGPPLLGVLGNGVGTLHSLAAGVVALAIAAVLAGATAPLGAADKAGADRAA